jgi:hypothetical protein
MDLSRLLFFGIFLPFLISPPPCEGAFLPLNESHIRRKQRFQEITMTFFSTRIATRSQSFNLRKLDLPFMNTQDSAFVARLLLAMVQFTSTSRLQSWIELNFRSQFTLTFEFSVPENNLCGKGLTYEPSHYKWRTWPQRWSITFFSERLELSSLFSSRLNEIEVPRVSSWSLRFHHSGLPAIRFSTTTSIRPKYCAGRIYPTNAKRATLFNWS